jgi:hypothetical protein
VSLPLVSVVVPVYQGERFLASALDSLLAQTYPADRLEIVVVDDGSTDGTHAALAPYRGRVRYLRKPNGGLVSAVNHGLGAIGGELVAFLDHDDLLREDKLERQVEHLLAHPGDGLVYCDLEVIDEDGEIAYPSFFAEHGIDARSGRVLGELMAYNFISAALMARTSLLERFWPIEPSAPCQGWPIALRVAELADVGLIREPLYRYRVHGANMNLGAGEAAKLELLRREVPFRRFLLRAIDLSALRPAQVVRAFGALEELACHVARTLPLPMAELYDCPPERRERARESVARGLLALDRGDDEAALHHFVLALADDRLDATARRGLAAAQARCLEPGAPARSRGRGEALVAGARGVRVVAHAAEVLAEPGLLEAWAGAVSAQDDVTLVLACLDDQPGPACAEALAALVGELGLDGPRAPDLLAAIDVPEAVPALAAAVDATWSRRPLRGALGLLPRLDPAAGRCRTRLSLAALGTRARLAS